MSRGSALNGWQTDNVTVSTLTAQRGRKMARAADNQRRGLDTIFREIENVNRPNTESLFHPEKWETCRLRHKPQRDSHKHILPWLQVRLTCLHCLKFKKSKEPHATKLDCSKQGPSGFRGFTNDSRVILCYCLSSPISTDVSAKQPLIAFESG